MKELTQSLEKYLTAIHKIVEKNTAARVKDVAKEMNIGIASTSEAVKALAKKDIVTLREISNYFYRTSGIYFRICNYFA